MCLQVFRLIFRLIGLKNINEWSSLTEEAITFPHLHTEVSRIATFKVKLIFSCATEIALQGATTSHHLWGLFPLRLLTTESQWCSVVSWAPAGGKFISSQMTKLPKSKIFLTVAAFLMINASFHEKQISIFFFIFLKNKIIVEVKMQMHLQLQYKCISPLWWLIENVQVCGNSFSV